MRLQPILFLLTLMIVSPGLSGGDVRASEQDFALTVQPFFKNHCVECHGPAREEGGVRVDHLKWDLDDLASVDDLQNVLDEIVVDSMPPAEQPRPSARELKEITKVLGRHMAQAKAKHSSGGGKPVRRLTRTEYVNTLYDLLGVYVDPKQLPEDGNAGSFDTQAVDLYTTDMHIEACLDVARNAAKRFIASRNSKPGQKKLKGTAIRLSKKKTFGIRANDVPPAGYQIARLVCWQKDPSRSTRVFFGPRLTPKFEVTGTPDSPQHIDQTFYEQGKIEWKASPEVIVGEIQNIQVINPQPYDFFEDVRSRYGDQVPDSAAGDLISQFVTMINRGRQVDRKLVSDLLKSFRIGRQNGETFWQAMVEPMALSMCTIEAMFHFENRSKVKKSRYVSPVEMVNRVSYFLWRSAPDDELIGLARSGKWYDAEVRKPQFARMVKDEKFERFLEDFITQWLELDRQDEVAVDGRVFPDFNSSGKESLKQETIQFVSHVIRNNLSLRNLIDSDFMLANGFTAEHYGIPGISGNEFRVVPVPVDSRRGGILTHAGIMMQTGTGDRTSIVERGAFVARKLLNDPPGTPPPLVDELPSTGKAAATMTAVELINMHRKAPQCASCHNNIDPVGVGLEELDAVGLFRTVDKRLNPNIDKLSARDRRRGKKLTIELPLKIDGRVQGRRIRGVDGLKKVLLSKDHQLAQAYIEALLSMANGRKAGVADKTIVDSIVQRAKAADLPALSILVAVLRSNAFRTH